MTRRRKGRTRALDLFWAEVAEPTTENPNRRVVKTKRDALMDAFGAGLSVSKACAYAGVAESTFFDEQVRDAEFADQVARARARTHARAMLVLQRAGSDDWRAAAEFLRLSDPDEYGNRLNLKSEQRVEIVSTILVAVKEAIEFVIPDPAIRVRIAEVLGARLSEAMGGSGTPAIRALPPHREAAGEPGGLGNQREPADDRGAVAAR